MGVERVVLMGGQQLSVRPCVQPQNPLPDSRWASARTALTHQRHIILVPLRGQLLRVAPEHVGLQAQRLRRAGRGGAGCAGGAAAQQLGRAWQPVLPDGAIRTAVHLESAPTAGVPAGRGRHLLLRRRRRLGRRSLALNAAGAAAGALGVAAGIAVGGAAWTGRLLRLGGPMGSRRARALEEVAIRSLQQQRQQVSRACRRGGAGRGGGPGQGRADATRGVGSAAGACQSLHLGKRGETSHLPGH